MTTQKKYGVTITILRRLDNKSFTGAYTVPMNSWKPCQHFKDGQKFIVPEHDVIMPDGFCSWAWADIQKWVMALARGANFCGVKHGVFVTCCTDGFRPVIFKLERVNPQKNIKATKQ